ncbi:hypothetical protein PA19B1_06713 [Cutibacterium acnes 19B1]|nr:hypothetical protein [Cutibacterium acnes 19B1]
MTLRASAADHSTWRLPVVAFAVIATIILDVTGGAVMMWHLPGDNSGFYKLTSTIAVILLVLPLMTLAASAARLSARRRDDRLSSLRLVGASSHLLRIVALTEAGLQALIGSIPGITGYVLCLPLLGQLSFNGGKVGADSILLGSIPVAGVILTLVLLALVSSAIGLRKIDVSPLGVRMRSQPRSVSWVRLAVGGAIVLLIVFSKAVLGLLGHQTGMVGVYVFIAVILAAVVELANIIGPKLLAMYFQHRLQRAKAATDLVAARQVLENPRAAWTQVASLRGRNARRHRSRDDANHQQRSPGHEIRPDRRRRPTDRGGPPHHLRVRYRCQLGGSQSSFRDPRPSICRGGVGHRRDGSASPGQGATHHCHLTDAVRHGHRHYCHRAAARPGNRNCSHHPASNRPRNGRHHCGGSGHGSAGSVGYPPDSAPGHRRWASPN